MNTEVQDLVSQISIDLGTNHERWFVPRGYASTALAVLDSIYSTGNHYTGVQRLVSRYSELRRSEDGDPELDTATDLIRFIERSGGALEFAELTGYRWRAWSRHSAPLKAEVALDAARILQAHGVETVTSTRDSLSERSVREKSEIAKLWLRLPGQRSGLTWNYFLMLSGLPGVKADRMIRRYVTRALGRERRIGAKDASHLVEQAADQLGIRYSTLDHTIWRFESGRTYLQE